jgi:lipoprotein-anchoring transpeptidase ErfK/SrfK
MILRSILLLGVGAALACAAPAFAAGASAPATTQAAKSQTQTVAALETGSPDAAQTPKAAKPKAKSKKLAKAKAKKKPAVAEAAKPEKQSFFSALFGGSSKKLSPKPDGKTKLAKTADGRPVAKIKQSAKPVEPEPEPIDISITSNSGELRSEKQVKKPTVFASLFGESSKPQLLPETRALDSVLQRKQAKKAFKVKPAFEPQEVEFSGYSSGTIVIDTKSKFLYLVEDSSTARRYAIAVGREGLLFTGRATVGDKQEWPRWIPTLDMQKREPKHYGQYKDGMDGGPENPLGARAIYLFQGRSDTHIRIHGTNQPQSIGSAASNGCFRMINDHVIDLYNRVRVGTPVVVL